MIQSFKPGLIGATSDSSQFRFIKRFYFKTLNTVIIIFLFVIAITYTSGGFSFTFCFLKIESHSLLKPGAILILLFLLKVITDSGWREFLKYILSIKGITFCLLVSTAGLAAGLFSYDMDHPERIFAYLSKGIPLADSYVLIRHLLFHLILFNSIWIIYSRIASRSRSLPISTFLNKDGLIMGAGLLYLLPFVRYKVGIDPQYIFFLRVTVPALIVGFKALLLKWGDDKIERSNYLSALIMASVAYFILFSILSTQKFNTFRSHIDLPVDLQSLWTTTQGKLFYLSWHIFPEDVEGKSYFGRHFEPIRLLFVPFYSLVKDPRFLLIIQSLILTLAVIPIYIFAKDRLKNDYIAFCLALSCLLSPLIQRVHLWAFVPYSMEPFITVLIIYFLFKREFIGYFLSIVLLYLSRNLQVSMLSSLVSMQSFS